LQGRLDHALRPCVRRSLDDLDMAVRDVLRLGAYQLLEVDRVADYSAVHATVELAKRVCPRAVSLVNAALRALQRQRETLPFPRLDAEPLRHLVTWGSHPEWLAERWLQRFGPAESEILCAYDNRRPDLCLRVHVGRTDVARVLEALPGAERGRWAAESVRCAASAFGPARQIVERGEASVQDEGATLVVHEADPRPGETWLDLAASPGGKACHLAERVGSTGHVLALDTTEPKVARLRANAARLGLSQLVGARGDARHLEVKPADGVLLDAPCSGLGVLSRRPDARWRKNADDLPRLQTLQGQLLLAAAQHVRPGGLLVYSVCSFEPEETVAVVEAFQAARPEFTLESGPAPSALRFAPGILYLLPQRHGVDGGFVARWRRAP